jgi:hypothetical protein
MMGDGEGMVALRQIHTMQGSHQRVHVNGARSKHARSG